MLRVNVVNTENLIDHFPAMVYTLDFDDEGMILFKDRNNKEI